MQSNKYRRENGIIGTCSCVQGQHVHKRTQTNWLQHYLHNQIHDCIPPSGLPSVCVMNYYFILILANILVWQSNSGITIAKIKSISKSSVVYVYNMPSSCITMQSSLCSQLILLLVFGLLVLCLGFSSIYLSLHSLDYHVLMESFSIAVSCLIQKPILDCVTVPEKCQQLASLLPKSLTMKNYVALQVELRR